MGISPGCVLRHFLSIFRPLRPLWRSISALVEVGDGIDVEKIVESVVEVVVENVADGTVEPSTKL